MSHALGRIDERQRADGARLPAEIGHWIDRAERVRDVSEGEQFYSAREQLGELIKCEGAVIAHRNKAKARAGSFGQQLPWHQVTVVLHLSEKNHVAGPQKSFAPSLRN